MPHDGNLLAPEQQALREQVLAQARLLAPRLRERAGWTDSHAVLHPDTVRDLEEIWEYIAADSFDAADRVREEIYDAVKSLVPFPFVDHSRPDLTARPLRFLTVRDYVIAYAPEEKPLWVIAVLHGHRSPQAMAAILRNRAD